MANISETFEGFTYLTVGLILLWVGMSWLFIVVKLIIFLILEKKSSNSG